VLGYSRNTFLVIQPWARRLFAPHSGQRSSLSATPQHLIWVTVAIGLFGLVMAPLPMRASLGRNRRDDRRAVVMGLTYGPLGTTLSELFPTRVRYTGSSLTFNLAGIFGASLAPYIATWLAQNYGLQVVGYYVGVAALVTLVGLIAIRETKDQRL
jgi:MFS family permease